MAVAFLILAVASAHRWRPKELIGSAARIDQQGQPWLYERAIVTSCLLVTPQKMDEKKMDDDLVMRRKEESRRHQAALQREVEAHKRLRQRKLLEEPPRRKTEGGIFRKPKRPVDGVITMARSVRATGSQLPIFFTSFASEVESHRACVESEHLAMLNVTCFLAAVEPAMGYGYPKIAAVAAVPAREVLWIDQDAWFAKVPDVLFDDTGYVTTGALFWPDLFDFFHKDDLVWETVGCGPDGRLYDCGLCRRLGLVDKRKDLVNRTNSSSCALYGDLVDDDEETDVIEDDLVEHTDDDRSFFSKARQPWWDRLTALDNRGLVGEDDEDDEVPPEDDDDVGHFMGFQEYLENSQTRRLEEKGWCECPRKVADERWNLTSRSEAWTTFSKTDWAARQGFDTGILVVDKSKVAYQIELTDHLARRGDAANAKWAKYSLGDKDLWHLAWMLSGAKYALSPYAAMVGSSASSTTRSTPTDLRYLLVAQAKLDDRRSVIVLHQNWRSIINWGEAALAIADLRHFDSPPFEGSGKDLLSSPVNFGKFTSGASIQQTFDNRKHKRHEPQRLFDPPIPLTENDTFDEEVWTISRSPTDPPHVFVTRPAPFELLQSLADVRRVWEYGADAFWGPPS